MSEGQESDGNSMKTYNVLEENIRIAREEREQAELEYNDVHHRIASLKDMLIQYQEHKEKVPHKYDTLIGFIALAMMVLSVGYTSYVLGSLTLKILLSKLWLKGIISLVSIPVIGYIELKLLKKIQELTECKVRDKVVNSEEYQVVLFQIETIKEDLSNALSDELAKKINLKDATAKYSAALSEMKVKESMRIIYNEYDPRTKTSAYVRKRRRY